MIEETIITLSNGSNYKILMESVLDDKKYCLTVLLDEMSLETENYQFFEVLNKDGKEVMRLINDNDILQQLVVLFAANYSKLTENLGGNN